MTDAALTGEINYAQVRVREPLGDRILGESPSIGGDGSDVVVPGVAPGVALRIERRKGVWVAHAQNDARVRFDGRLLTGRRDLRRHDVLSVGDAQIAVTDASRTLLKLEVFHLAGNPTISPADSVAVIAPEDGDEDLLIQAPRTPSANEIEATANAEAEAARVRAAASALEADRAARKVKGPRPPRSRRFKLAAAMLAAIALVFVVLVSQLNVVVVDADPGDAEISVPGTVLSIHTGGQLLLLSGEHVIRGEHAGYVPAQTAVTVRRNEQSTARLKLAKLPGSLNIDTGQVAAVVSVDGVETGRAPGIMSMAAGRHTVTLRAPRYVDYITSIDIEGTGVRQDLKVAMQSSWGTLQITTIPAGAHVAVDGTESGTSPIVVDAPSGVRQIRISAPNLKTWESSVVLKAGAVLNVGPIILGQPDAHLVLASVPSGAEVTVDGAHRGRTPFEADVAAGVQHEVMVNLPGYATWTQQAYGESGKKVSLQAKLNVVGAMVTVQGQPDGADLFVDGADKGHTPLSLELSATEHRIEVRKEGWVTYTGTVTPAKGFDKKVEYHLAPQDHYIALAQTASTIFTQTGYMLKLVPPGAFDMGSKRQEQGHRPNEGFRRVTFKRPFYFGATEVTNEQYHRFRPAHSSGVIEKHSLDLNDQPVSQVSWSDAAQYCNWLSERDNLPPAYEKKNDEYVLRRPVTIGYRLPTEAEWEYSARLVEPGQFRRFAWGDALPVPAGVGNLAGSETGNSSPESLPNYRDDYPLVAPVGKFKPTPLGIHDLSGNVSEWIDDYYLSFVESAPVIDPLGPEDGTRHVIRGANWKTGVAMDLRLAWRDGADAARNTTGFRVVRYAE